MSESTNINVVPIPPPTIPRPTSHMNGKTSDSVVSQGSTQVHPQTEVPFDLTSYIYNAGFVHAAWADTFLNISPHPPLRLHALLASRSPLLYRFLSNYVNQGPPYNINITCNDPNITTQSLSMALATLYGHQLDIVNCSLSNLKGLVAAGNLLGLESVVLAGYQGIVNSVSRDTLADLFSFVLSKVITQGSNNGSNTANTGSSSGSSLDSNPSQSSGLSSSSSPGMGENNGLYNSTPGSSNGTTNPNALSFEDISMTYPGPYPPFTNQLLSILVDFLLLDMNASEKPLDSIYKSILVGLPFYVYKFICESDKLKVKSHMERHSFAREMTGLREHARRAQLQANSGNIAYEENVVLAFGGGKGGVEVIRKMAGKKKTLWKASQ